MAWKGYRAGTVWDVPVASGAFLRSKTVGGGGVLRRPNVWKWWKADIVSMASAPLRVIR